MKNKEIILYYSDLLCKKIDLHVDAFIDRIEAIRTKELTRVEFIEEMTLKPLDMQISYLTKKLLTVLQKGE
jgi:hypothetical protein